MTGVTVLGVKQTKDTWVLTLSAAITATEGKVLVEAKAESFLKIYNKTKAIVDPSQTPHTPQTPPADQNPLKAASDYMKAQREAREKLAEMNA